MDHPESVDFDQSANNELERLREESAKKDRMIEKLIEEVSLLRRQLSEFTRKIEFYASYNESSDEGSEMEAEVIPSLASDERNPTIEDNEGFQVATKRKRKPKRKNTIRSSSDEEDEVPSKKASANSEGKPAEVSQKIDKNFPPLPKVKPNLNPVKPVTAKKLDPRPTKVKAIPPIVVTNAGNFTSISSLFRTNNIKYSSAVVVRNGIKVFPTTEEDYRKATRLLDNNKEPYYTFRFPEERLNHVVLRNAPTHLSKEEMMADLIRQGFTPKNIIRWKHRDGRPMPMVLVLLPKAEKDIYKIKMLCTFEVRAEAQISKSRSIQCYNCQDHGHAAPCCHVPPKCVKCGASHHSTQCTKPREEPPKCANCGGDHPASFSGCPNHPLQIKTKKKSSFQGWGSQDNSRLASNSTPATAPAEPLLSNAQLAQISKLFAEQLKILMIQTQNKR